MITIPSQDHHFICPHKIEFSVFLKWDFITGWANPRDFQVGNADQGIDGGGNLENGRQEREVADVPWGIKVMGEKNQTSGYRPQ